MLLPLIALLIALVDGILPAVEPNRENIKNSKKAYGAIAVSGTIFIAIVHGTMILSSLDRKIDAASVIAIALGIFLMLVGNYLSKIRRNYTFGFRTPWTLSSNLAWHKTHRQAGWSTVIHGLLFVIAGWQSNISLLVAVIISFVMVTIIILPVYSYFLWTSDPNRIVE